MISTKFLIFISYLTVISVQSTSGQWTESVITEFRGGMLGAMGGQCLDRALLAVKKYEDFVSVFEKPDGANEYFATSSEGVAEYCIENVGSFTADVDYEVHVFIYTSGGPGIITWSVIDLLSSEVLETDVAIDESRIWTTSTLKLTRRSSYKIRLEYTKVNDDAFFAIDKFVLRMPIPTEAPPTDTTVAITATEAPSTVITETTTRTEAPPTDTTDGITATEAPTTDVTETTTGTEAPPTDTTDAITATEAPSTGITETTTRTEAPPTDTTAAITATETATTDITETTTGTEASPTDTTDAITATEAPSTGITETTTRTEAPPTDTTDAITVTEAPSTGITEATTATEAPPTVTTEATPPTETPPAVPCKCVCNCNFFCNRKTIFP